MQATPIRPLPSQAVRFAVTTARQAKVDRKRKREGRALIAFFCANGATKFEGDTLALLLDQVKTAHTERNATVLALFAEADNVDNSPVVLYQGMKAAHAAFGIFDLSGSTFPSYAKWFKARNKAEKVETVTYAAVDD